MFVETYFDERAPVSGNTSEPVIPYPELLGDVLTVWQKYLPIRRPIKDLHSWRFDMEPVPRSVITEIERVKNAKGLFDRVEIWGVQAIRWRSGSSRGKNLATFPSSAGGMRRSRRNR